MADVRKSLTLTMVSVAVFGMALLGGMGSCAAGKAAAAASMKNSATASQQQREEASAMEVGSVLSSVFFFVGLVIFAILLFMSVYQR